MALDVRARVTAYYEAISCGDIEAVLAMFAAAGEMRDPVGTPAASDDMGRRERYSGIGAIFDRLELTAERVIAGGNEAAASWTARGRTKAGKDVTFSGLSVFVFDDDGAITRMSAYWEPAAVVAALQG